MTDIIIMGPGDPDEGLIKRIHESSHDVVIVAADESTYLSTMIPDHNFIYQFTNLAYDCSAYDCSAYDYEDLLNESNPPQQNELGDSVKVDIINSIECRCRSPTKIKFYY